MTTKVQVHIRRVRCEAFAAEADATATMYLASRRAMLPNLRNLHTDAATRAWMRDTVFTQHSVRVAEVDGEIVGFASRDGSWLMNLYVKPGWTGHGIGTQLLRAMLANAASSTPMLRVCTFARNEQHDASSRSAASLGGTRDGSAIRSTAQPLRASTE
jgi:GNAT superfamily N-acetyltransferase